MITLRLLLNDANGIKQDDAFAVAAGNKHDGVDVEELDAAAVVAAADTEQQEPLTVKEIIGTVRHRVPNKILVVIGNHKDNLEFVMDFFWN